jgi:hypothetical protein
MVMTPPEVSPLRSGPYNSQVARPLPSERVPPALEEDAPVDPSAIELRYRFHRAQRHARVLQRQESRLARYRFYIVLLVLIAIAVAFVLGSWHEIQRLFGL